MQVEEILVARSSSLEVFSVCTRARKFTWHPPGESCCRLLNRFLRNAVIETVDSSQELGLSPVQIMRGS